MAARSKAWLCGRSLSAIVGSNQMPRGYGCLSFVSVVCCLVEVSASGRSLVQRDPTDCGEFNECDRAAPYGEGHDLTSGPSDTRKKSNSE